MGMLPPAHISSLEAQAPIRQSGAVLSGPAHSLIHSLTRSQEHDTLTKVERDKKFEVISCCHPALQLQSSWGHQEAVERYPTAPVFASLELFRQPLRLPRFDS